MTSSIESRDLPLKKTKYICNDVCTRIFFTNLSKNLSTKQMFIKGRALKSITVMTPDMELWTF